MASSDMVDPTSSPPLQLDSISIVDLQLLSQSELYALSFCSDASFDPLRCDDDVIPKIDRSVFNESAGSRKQTYTRFRLAPATSDSSATATIRRHGPHLSSSKPPPNVNTETDTDSVENFEMIGLFKELFADETRGDEVVPIRVDYSDSLPQLSNTVTNVGKRKRGRPRKDEKAVVPVAVEVEVETLAASHARDDAIRDVVVYQNVDDRDREIVNRRGGVVDLVALARLEDPYGAELRRRTEGLETKEELLGFLTGLNGQWGSIRKKKKIVDANEFGDALPKGWKLFLSIKKKQGRVWLFCHRYIRFLAIILLFALFAVILFLYLIHAVNGQIAIYIFWM